MHQTVVLHVEDRDDVAAILEAAIRESAHSVNLFRVRDGEEALAFLRQNGCYLQALRPKLMLLDLNMPKFDGWSVLAAMQSDKPLCTIPVVVFSTSLRKSDEARALTLGARGYIVKPSFFEDWVQQVNSALTKFLLP